MSDGPDVPQDRDPVVDPADPLGLGDGPAEEPAEDAPANPFASLPPVPQGSAPQPPVTPSQQFAPPNVQAPPHVQAPPQQSGPQQPTFRPSADQAFTRPHPGPPQPGPQGFVSSVPQQGLQQQQPGPGSWPAAAPNRGPSTPPGIPQEHTHPGQGAAYLPSPTPPIGQDAPGPHLTGPPPQGPQVVQPERVPTAQDFLLNRHQNLDVGPATWGWRGFLRKATFGLIKPKMGKAERQWRAHRAAVQRSFDGPRTIVFANPKGGAAKTTSVLAAGYTFGTVRGGGVVAWDNNETRGTLGIRGERASHSNTTRELLDDLEKFQDVYESRIGDLGAFVRSQGDAHFDVLASDERADVTGTIHADDFDAVHRLLERFYHVILVDTGNNLRAENWLAAARTADLIVVTSTVREDTGYSGLWMLDALADAGHPDIRNRTITVLCDPSAKVDDQLAKDLTEVYEKRTRAVFRIPYDPALVAGSVIDYRQLSQKTRDAWLKACAAMAQAL